MRKIVFTVLLFISLNVSAENPQLSLGGMVVIPAERCDEPGMPLVCVGVMKDGIRYIVVLDTKGEKKILQLIGEDFVLIWSRESI